MSPGREFRDFNDAGSTSGTIRIVAAIVTDETGRILVVRKRSTVFFMQPGGKIETGEALVDTLARELREELGAYILTTEFLGDFTAPAANEHEHVVEAALFRVEITGSVEPRAEIEEIAWIDPSQPVNLPIAPLTREHVLRLVKR